MLAFLANLQAQRASDPSDKPQVFTVVGCITLVEKGMVVYYFMFVFNEMVTFS